MEADSLNQTIEKHTRALKSARVMKTGTRPWWSMGSVSRRWRTLLESRAVGSDAVMVMERGHLHISPLSSPCILLSESQKFRLGTKLGENPKETITGTKWSEVNTVARRTTWQTLGYTRDSHPRKEFLVPAVWEALCSFSGYAFLPLFMFLGAAATMNWNEMR